MQKYSLYSFSLRLPKKKNNQSGEEDEESTTHGSRSTNSLFVDLKVEVFAGDVESLEADPECVEIRLVDDIDLIATIQTELRTHVKRIQNHLLPALHEIAEHINSGLFIHRSHFNEGCQSNGFISRLIIYRIFRRNKSQLTE